MIDLPLGRQRHDNDLGRVVGVRVGEEDGAAAAGQVNGLVRGWDVGRHIIRRPVPVMIAFVNIAKFCDYFTFQPHPTHDIRIRGIFGSGAEPLETIALRREWRLSCR